MRPWGSHRVLRTQVLYSRVRTFRGFQDMFFQSLTPHIFWYSFVKANSQVPCSGPDCARCI